MNKLIDNLEVMKAGWLETKKERIEWGDISGAALCVGVIRGIELSIEEVRKMTESGLKYTE